MTIQEPSRREQVESTLLYLAKQGKMEYRDCPLFISRAKALRKKGFDVYFKRRMDQRDKEVPVVISWEKAFKEEIPPIVSRYISGQEDTYPLWELKNLAQELYTIAARAQYEKNHKKTTE